VKSLDDEERLHIASEIAKRLLAPTVPNQKE
jgi:hypothetical protein